MAFAKKVDSDLTVHWTEDGKTSVCGQDVASSIRGRGVTSLINRAGETGEKACGRCLRTLESQKKKVLESIESFSKVA